ncbi:type III pantothenate kinase [Allohahella marinimesophila]|uniref:Type III pantothenate kinase n=1 Tax=Allohahella marinimesophila TaxID=1054972 RepID=A0ABP7QCP7_9GAMM
MIDQPAWPTQLLLVDAGNTRLKFKLIRERAVKELRAACGNGEAAPRKQQVIETILEAESVSFANAELAEADSSRHLAAVSVLRDFLADQRHLVLVSSVAPSAVVTLLQRSASEGNGVVELARVKQDAMGVSMRYGAIGTLGVDRWLGMVAAFQRVEGAVCVVDCGTAITVDFLAADGVHEGGLIAPGFSTSLSSLNMADSLKSAVRVVALEEAGADLKSSVNRQERLGLSSAKCIFHGVDRMTVAFLDSIFSQVEFAKPPCQLLITGGGWPALAYAPLVNYRYVQELVFEGLVHAWVAGHTEPFPQKP